VSAAAAACLHGKVAAVICSQPALNLHANLPHRSARSGVNADEIVAFIIERRFVGENVAAHEIAHDEMAPSQADTTGNLVNFAAGGSVLARGIDLTRYGWNFSAIFLGIIPCKPLAHLGTVR
jgi:hypothetical protein